jgi:sortase A
VSADAEVKTPPRSSGPTGIWLAIRTAGEVLVTFGALVLLFVAYQVWWTNVEAAAATEHVASDLVQSWQAPPSEPTEPAPSASPGQSTPAPSAKPAAGQAFGLLTIPRLGDKVYELPVLEGVGLDVLAKGAGHYESTALPGQLGNFAIAAHRATQNEPFRNIDDLRVGDLAYVRTRDSWFTYRLERDEIVKPTETWVIEPVPGQPGVAPTKALITLTTCNPRWASYERWIWWGSLVLQQPVSAGPPAGYPKADA